MFRFKLKVSSSLIFIFFAQLISFFIWAEMGSYFSCVVFLTFSVLCLLDIATLLINSLLAKKIEIRRDVHDKFIEGDSINLKLFIKNRGSFPFINVEIHDYLPWVENDGKVVFSVEWLGKGDVLERGYSSTCKHRGKYTLERINLIVRGIVGIVFIEKAIDINNVVYVYPETFFIARIPPLVKGYLPWFGLDTISAGGDDDEFFGLREYKRGDSLKRIHWLSVARKNKLVVKEFQKCAFYQASLVFVLHKSYKQGKSRNNIVEYIIKAAASLTRYFIQNNICVELLAHAGKLAIFYPSNKGGEYMDELFKFYAEAQAESHLTLKDFLSEYYNLLPYRSTVFVLMTEKEIDDIAGFLHLKDKDIEIIAIVFLTYSFSYDLDEHENLTLKERVASKLSALGVRAFVCVRGDNLGNLFLSTR